MVQDRRGRPSRELLTSTTINSSSTIGGIQISHTIFGHNHDQFHWNAGENWRSGYFIWRMNLSDVAFGRLNVNIWADGGSGTIAVHYVDTISVGGGLITTTTTPTGIEMDIPGAIGIYATEWISLDPVDRMATTINAQDTGQDIQASGDRYLQLIGTSVDARFGMAQVQFRPEYEVGG